MNGPRDEELVCAFRGQSGSSKAVNLSPVRQGPSAKVLHAGSVECSYPLLAVELAVGVPPVKVLVAAEYEGPNRRPKTPAIWPMRDPVYWKVRLHLSHEESGIGVLRQGREAWTQPHPQPRYDSHLEVCQNPRQWWEFLVARRVFSVGSDVLGWVYWFPLSFVYIRATDVGIV